MAPARAGETQSFARAENERKRPLEGALGCIQERLGLDLWFKPLDVIHCWSRAGPLGPNLFYVAQRVPQGGEPGVLVLPHQPHAPGERIAAAAGHAGLDERVEHPALGLAQPGHDRNGKCGEHHFPALADHAPGHLAAEQPLRLPRDPDPGLAGLLAEPPAPAGRDRIRPGLSRPGLGALGRRLGGLGFGLPGPHRGQVTDNRDRLTVQHYFGLAVEPAVRQAAKKPAAYLLSRAPRRALSLCTHVIMITHNARCRNDWLPHHPVRGGSPAGSARTGLVSNSPSGAGPPHLAPFAPIMQTGTGCLPGERNGLPSTRALGRA